MSIGDRVRFAIETECTSIKAGNVHPHASFDDLTYQHFLLAAKAIGAAVDQTIGEPVGRMVLVSVQAMMSASQTNTSLGTILLMAPLIVAQHRTLTLAEGSTQAVVAAGGLSRALAETLETLTPKDSLDIYEAIRIAKPGGLGDSKTMDVRETAPQSIMDAMRIAADWDDIALQYASDFEMVFAMAQRLQGKLADGMAWRDAIPILQLEWLSERVDSLIARKQGRDVAEKVRQQARQVLASGPIGSRAYEMAWTGLDASLRDPQHRGNPGTTADLIAAAIFITDGSAGEK